MKIETMSTLIMSNLNVLVALVRNSVSIDKCSLFCKCCVCVCNGKACTGFPLTKEAECQCFSSSSDNALEICADQEMLRLRFAVLIN